MKAIDLTFALFLFHIGSSFATTDSLSITVIGTHHSYSPSDTLSLVLHSCHPAELYTLEFSANAGKTWDNVSGGVKEFSTSREACFCDTVQAIIPDSVIESTSYPNNAFAVKKWRTAVSDSCSVRIVLYPEGKSAQSSLFRATGAREGASR